MWNIEEEMLQEEECQNKKRERSCVQSIEQEKKSYGRKTKTLKSAAKKNKQRDIRRTFKILRKIQLNIGVKKVDMHKGITVKALLDSGVTGMFINRKMVVKHGFRLQKLNRPVMVRNIDGTNNSAGAITYQVEVNIYYKNHVKRMKMDVCNLEKTNMILEILQLQIHNPKTNWKIGEVKMTKYPL